MRFCRYMLALLPLTMVIAGCGSKDEDEPETLTGERSFRYQITITNLSAGQPFSPPALVIHRDGWQAFTLGEEASVALEKLAESGDNGEFIALADADSSVLATESGAGGIAPGATAEILATATADTDNGLLLTWLSMPVNTNDGLTGLRGIDLGGFSSGDSRTYLAISYDAGTEANSESADTVPGPAASGLAEGFNAARNDVRNQVYLHPGVVTQDDGLSTSTLVGAQRWHNPIASVRIERVQ